MYTILVGPFVCEKPKKKCLFNSCESGYISWKTIDKLKCNGLFKETVTVCGESLGIIDHNRDVSYIKYGKYQNIYNKDCEIYSDANRIRKLIGEDIIVRICEIDVWCVPRVLQADIGLYDATLSPNSLKMVEYDYKNFILDHLTETMSSEEKPIFIKDMEERLFKIIEEERLFKIIKGENDMDVLKFMAEDSDVKNDDFCDKKRSNDNVNNPAHYNHNGIETIDVIQAWTDELVGIQATDTGNVIKYISRWKDKNGLEDLKKAEWYLKHLIEHVEKNGITPIEIYNEE